MVTRNESDNNTLHQVVEGGGHVFKGTGEVIKGAGKVIGGVVHGTGQLIHKCMGGRKEEDHISE